MHSFLHLSNIPLCVCTTTALSIHLPSLRSTYPGHLFPAGWSRTMDSEGSTHCTILTPGPSRPHSPPCVSSSHWTGVWEAQSAAIFPQEPSCKAMKISQLCFLATLLTLLGTLMASIPGCEPSNQAQGKSRLILPLWRQGMTGVHGRGWVAWVGWVLPTISGFLLGSGHFNSMKTFDSQKVLLCVWL